MTIPTEPIGSIPRPPRLIEAVAGRDGDDPALDPLYDEAIRDTFAASRRPARRSSPTASSASTTTSGPTASHGLPNTAPDGFRIPFAAGHTRRMPRLTAGPFRYQRYADSYLDVRPAACARVPVKQAVISPSALSLMYPAGGDPRLPARAVHRRPAPRARDARSARCLAQGRAQGADRLHRGPAGDQDRPHAASCCTASST